MVRLSEKVPIADTRETDSHVFTPLLHTSLSPCSNRPDSVGRKIFIGRNDTTLRYPKPSSVDGGEVPNLGSHLAEARRISAVMRCNAGGKWWDIKAVRVLGVFHFCLSVCLEMLGAKMLALSRSPLDASGKGICPGELSLNY